MSEKEKEILEEIFQQWVESNKKSFVSAFEKYKNFKNFDNFVESSTKEGNENIRKKLTLEDFQKFDINKTLWENFRDIMLKQCEPNLETTKFNMAVMFAYNLEEEIAVDSIKDDDFWYNIIKQELIQKEMYEDLGKLEKIRQNIH